MKINKIPQNALMKRFSKCDKYDELPVKLYVIFSYRRASKIFYNKATCQLVTKQGVSSSIHLPTFKWHISNWWCWKSFTPFSSKSFWKNDATSQILVFEYPYFPENKRFRIAPENVFRTRFYKWLCHFKLKCVNVLTKFKK